MLDKVTRVKKTREIVIPIGKADSMHTWCLFSFGEKSKKGNLANVRSVRNDNLKTDGES
jgi:hypothetical protein